MKVITKQPAKLPVPYTQQHILDGSYLKMIQDGRKFSKAEKNGFMKSGSTSSIFNHGNPNLNLNAISEAFNSPDNGKGVFHTLPHVSLDTPTYNGISR